MPNSPKRAKSDQSTDPEADVPETISVAEAAARLGIGVKAVRKAAEKGSLPAVQIGTRWRILRRPFEAMLNPKLPEDDM